MGRFEELTNRLSDEIAQTVAEGGVPNFASIEAALVNLEQAELAEHNSYKTCTCCKRIYTEGQYSLLKPAAGGLWSKDEWQLDEYRICAVCSSTLVVTRAVYKVYAERKVVPLFRVADAPMPCDGCTYGIHAGERYLHRARPPGPPVSRFKTNLCLSCAKHL